MPCGCACGTLWAQLSPRRDMALCCQESASALAVARHRSSHRAGLGVCVRSAAGRGFLRLQALLKPFGLTRYYTDGWGSDKWHVDATKHTVRKEYMQKIESKHIQSTNADQALGAPHDLLFEDGANARSGD